MSRPLGPRQREVMALLVRFGRWYRGCAWPIGPDSRIVRVLEGLRMRGLADKEPTADFGWLWRPTNLGRDLVGATIDGMYGRRR